MKYKDLLAKRLHSQNIYNCLQGMEEREQTEIKNPDEAFLDI